MKAFIFSSTGRLGLTSSLTSRIPLAIVGPMSISGLGFSNALHLNERGLLEPTEQMKATLADTMDLQVKSGRRRSRCPVAGFFAGKNQGELKSPHENLDKAGLQLLAETYWKVFQVVSKENPEGSTPTYEHASDKLFTMNTPKPAEKPKAKNPFEKMRQGLEELIFGREP